MGSCCGLNAKRKLIVWCWWLHVMLYYDLGSRQINAIIFILLSEGICGIQSSLRLLPHILISFCLAAERGQQIAFSQQLGQVMDWSWHSFTSCRWSQDQLPTATLSAAGGKQHSGALCVCCVFIYLFCKSQQLAPGQGAPCTPSLSEMWTRLPVPLKNYELLPPERITTLLLFIWMLNHLYDQ